MTANIIVLLFNGLTLALALGLMLLVLWHDPDSEGNRSFAVFLIMMVIWSSGSLLARAGAYVNASSSTIESGLRLLDVGYFGAGIGIYMYSAVIAGASGRLFRTFSWMALGFLLAYQIFLALSGTVHTYEVTAEGGLNYEFDQISIVLFLAFQIGSIAIVWRNRLRIRSPLLTSSILLFASGQILGLVSVRFRELGIAEDISSVAAFLMSYAVVRQQIMLPLLGKAKQLEAVRDVGLAITSRLHLEDTLGAIAAQAAGLLNADGAAIFLRDDREMELAAVYDLPHQFIGYRIAFGVGVVGRVVVERRGYRLDNYARDWRGEPDLPLAQETFGAVVCVPLMFADEVVGVLLVIQGKQGQLFNREDMHLLELLGPQAAVAITNSRLFEAERNLSNDLVVAKNRLETVLTSTENPVVAVNRDFRIVFANPAACTLLQTEIDPVGWRIVDFVPRNYLPPDPRLALRALRQHRVFVYEIEVGQHIYLCHVAELSKPYPEGWVLVLNDVTQLKELDSLKSQMVQMTSHDLKNPLQAAMSYLELLQEEAAQVLDDEMREYIDTVWTQLTRMYRIINGILDLERVQSATPRMELCAVEDILGRVVEDLQAQAHQKHIHLSLSVDAKLPLIRGDSQQLGQAISNLLDNALKFTPDGGQVKVSATANEQLTISVVDSGVGIPYLDQQHIFERFFQGRQQSQAEVRGSGLGLSLVKAVVDQHDGKIEFTSVPGEGTTFYVRLPIILLGSNEKY